MNILIRYETQLENAISMGTTFMIETANERKWKKSQKSDLISPDRAILRHQPGSVSVFRRYLRSFAFICGSKRLFGPLET
ncbi:MAG: hypothetical protein CVV18_07430, partial [Gammaproteobacteria bacterium HGW-Gammaproteobacteria-8]